MKKYTVVQIVLLIISLLLISGCISAPIPVDTDHYSDVIPDAEDKELQDYDESDHGVGFTESDALTDVELMQIETRPELNIYVQSNMSESLDLGSGTQHMQLFSKFYYYLSIQSDTIVNFGFEASQNMSLIQVISTNETITVTSQNSNWTCDTAQLDPTITSFCNSSYGSQILIVNSYDSGQIEAYSVNNEPIVNTPPEFNGVEYVYYAQEDQWGEDSLFIDIMSLVTDVDGDIIDLELTGLNGITCSYSDSSNKLQCSVFGSCGSATMTASDGTDSTDKSFLICPSSDNPDNTSLQSQSVSLETGLAEQSTHYFAQPYTTACSDDGDTCKSSDENGYCCKGDCETSGYTWPTTQSSKEITDIGRYKPSNTQAYTGAGYRGGTHKGIDMHCEQGSEITTMHCGRVEFKGSSTSLGKWIVIEQMDGKCVGYGHLEDGGRPKVDTIVCGGDKIGACSNTGNAGGQWSAGNRMHVHVAAFQGDMSKPFGERCSMSEWGRPFINTESFWAGSTLAILPRISGAVTTFQP